MVIGENVSRIVKDHPGPQPHYIPLEFFRHFGVAEKILEEWIVFKGLKRIGDLLALRHIDMHDCRDSLFGNGFNHRNQVSSPALSQGGRRPDCQDKDCAK